MNIVRAIFSKIRALFLKFWKRAGETSPPPPLQLRAWQLISKQLASSLQWFFLNSVSDSENLPSTQKQLLGGVVWKKALESLMKDSQENTCVKVSFFSCELSEIFKNTVFVENLQWLLPCIKTTGLPITFRPEMFYIRSYSFNIRSYSCPHFPAFGPK